MAQAEGPGALALALEAEAATAPAVAPVVALAAAEPEEPAVVAGWAGYGFTETERADARNFVEWVAEGTHKDEVVELGYLEDVLNRYWEARRRRGMPPSTPRKMLELLRDEGWHGFPATARPAVPTAKALSYRMHTYLAQPSAARRAELRALWRPKSTKAKAPKKTSKSKRARRS
jgi:hypothetical protein